jgi:phosphoribosylamine--glycine ligase
VVKADGLAAGKGVVVAMTLAEAHEAIDDMLVDNTLGVATTPGGARVVIEEFLQGEEASFIVLCDGKNVLAAGHQPGPQAPAGMATRAPTPAAWAPIRPHPVVTPDVHARAMREIILPTIRAWKKTASPSPASCTPA